MKKLFKKLVNWIKSLFGGKKETPEDVAKHVKWVYGGVNGANAVEKAKISDLTVSKKQLAYKWVEGGCENLGAASRTDASCRACLFCHVNGEWVGGFFEWISTSRLTRNFANIQGRYKGWDISLVEKADKFAFCILSKSGGSRTSFAIQNGAARRDEFDPGDPDTVAAEFPIDQLD